MESSVRDAFILIMFVCTGLLEHHVSALCSCLFLCKAFGVKQLKLSLGPYLLLLNHRHIFL